MSYEHESCKYYLEKIAVYLMGINIQSFKAHHDQLTAELESYKTKSTVIAITETWLSINAILRVLGLPVPTGSIETTQKNEAERQCCVLSFGSG